MRIARGAPVGRRGTEPGVSVKTVVLERGREYIGIDGNSGAGGRRRGSHGGGWTGRIFGVGLGTNVPGFRGGRTRLAAVCCREVVICGCPLGFRGALTREKPTSVGRILVFANRVSVSPILWEGLRG